MARAALTTDERAFLETARRAVLATIDPAGRPRLVPVCFIVDGDTDPAIIHSPIDDKPKSAPGPYDLARIRDVAARPSVTLLVDAWDEDWTRLAWLRVRGTARIVAATPGSLAALLRLKYRQYESHDLEGRPAIRIAIEDVASWGDLSSGGRSPMRAASGPVRPRP